MLKRFLALTAVVSLGLTALDAQQAPAPPRDTLPDNPGIFDSSTRGPSGSPIAGPKFRVVALKGLQRPYGMAFLPDGAILITERAGRLRIVRNNVLDPQPISGMPAVLDRNLKGLNDIALHPDFARNRMLYFTYYKPVAGSQDAATAVLARARFDGEHALTEVKDIFTTSQVINQPSAARLVFDRDGKIYLGIGVPIPARTTAGNITTTTDAQSPGSHFGKILRLNDDGTPAAGNPFAGKPEYKPEIFALGIRNTMGLAIHPETGELWETENGPQGGDELNIIRAGKNYGWPTISYGRSVHRRCDGSNRPRLGSAGPSWARAADAVLGAVDCAVGSDVLHGRSFPGVEGQHLRRRPGRHPAPARRDESARPADPARHVAVGAAAADSRGPSGSGRLALSADRRRARRAAAA